MKSKKSYIPIKIFISYFVLATLFIGVSWYLYSQKVVFSRIENKIANNNNTILKLSNLLSTIYETESFSRKTIQSNSEIDFKIYISETDTLKSEIDKLKKITSTQHQAQLLDSLKFLISKKTENIRELKKIKNKETEEAVVKNAIDNLTKIELSLRRLELKDFVKNPSAMGVYQRSVLKKYVSYLNQNIPDDNTNTLSKKTSDSILIASKVVLNEVKKESEERRTNTNFEEKKLLQNELSISEQLRKIVSAIEKQILFDTTTNNLEKENSLKKTNQILTATAVIGLLLSLFFSILILHDFSKTQSYKTKLEIANTNTQRLLKSREQLISTVSHDLKTPLNTIVGYAELLGNSELTPKQLYFAKNIKGSSAYISKLVQDLLDFTQIEAGKITIENIPFSLNTIVNEVAKSIQSVYSYKAITLCIEIDKKLNQNILGDPFRLRQILENIIGNAFKFTEKGFIKINVNAHLETNLILLKIEDSGIGIDSKKQHLIFEEFTQADDTIEKKYGGSGLGLTISKKIISILGGKLSVSSVLGKGSVFEVELPLQYDTNPLPVKASIIALKKEFTVIVVDDDIHLLQLTAEVLSQQNYKIHSFRKASDALKAMSDIYFDLVVTDIQMPEIDGFLFIKKLKNSETINYKNQPIIAITGRTDLDLEIYKKAGFTLVIQKPYAPKALLEVIVSVLNDPKIHQDLNPKKEVPNTGETYSLAALQLFFTNENLALKDFLVTFMANTNKNLGELDNAILKNNFLEIKEIAHKINPMFKQIQAQEISAILNDLELKDFSIVEIKANANTLKTKITALFLLLEKEQTTMH